MVVVNDVHIVLTGPIVKVVHLLTTDIVQDVSVVTPTPSTSPSATPTPPPTPVVVAPKLLPSMRLISPVFGPANSVDTTGEIAQFYSAKTRAFYTYVASG